MGIRKKRGIRGEGEKLIRKREVEENLEEIIGRGRALAAILANESNIICPRYFVIKQQHSKKSAVGRVSR